jgi:hypothetical protein
MSWRGNNKKLCPLSLASRRLSGLAMDRIAMIVHLYELTPFRRRRIFSGLISLLLSLFTCFRFFSGEWHQKYI